MKTTVFVTHPNINQSRVNSALAKGAASLTDVEVRYLYDQYPDGKIDVAAEQAALEKTDRIVLQFPMQWYSTPPLLKQWLDDVLTYGWSHGGETQALRDKQLMLAVSLGGAESAYQPDGAAGHTVGGKRRLSTVWQILIFLRG
ncbi:NAD(P)H-dependent oxidoreductase [Klebsiella pneumoniae]|uniref:NAD(P)H-dependent oxidoreductase n=1 Tax=Klebsiella pneumoniae TaxID=573 RepID=UPI001F1DA40C|nr:NAD(P)H-dependent oxidoreductase [Klebsiella pneumoniae]